MKTRLCQIRRIQYKTHILNKIQNNPNFSLSSSIALKNLFTLNAILPPFARLHQSLQEKEEEEEEERRKRGEWKHKRAKLLPPGRGKFPRGSLRSLRSLNCAYLCPFASGRPENYYVTCLRRGAKRIRRRRRRRRGGDGAHDPLMPRAPSINRDTTPTSNLPHPSPSCSPFASSTPPLQPLLTDRIDLWGRCFDPKPKGLPIPSTTHPSSSCYYALFAEQPRRGEGKDPHVRHLESRGWVFFFSYSSLMRFPRPNSMLGQRGIIRGIELTGVECWRGEERGIDRKVKGKRCRSCCKLL